MAILGFCCLDSHIDEAASCSAIALLKPEIIHGHLFLNGRDDQDPDTFELPASLLSSRWMLYVQYNSVQIGQCLLNFAHF